LTAKFDADRTDCRVDFRQCKAPLLRDRIEQRLFTHKDVTFAGLKKFRGEKLTDSSLRVRTGWNSYID
jgi:hypothetical protein